jgi:hypothetical protein
MSNKLHKIFQLFRNTKDTYDKIHNIKVTLPLHMSPKLFISLKYAYETNLYIFENKAAAWIGTNVEICVFKC